MYSAFLVWLMDIYLLFLGGVAACGNLNGRRYLFALCSLEGDLPGTNRDSMVA